MSLIDGRIYRVIYHIRRNLATGPTTYGICERQCGRLPGRGSGPCLECCRDDLATLVGAELANRYVAASCELGDCLAEIETFSTEPKGGGG